MNGTIRKKSIFSKRPDVSERNLLPVDHFDNDPIPEGTEYVQFDHLVDPESLTSTKCSCPAPLPTLTYKINPDLRSMCPRIYDQGHLGSCTANAGCLLYSMVCAPQYHPSRLFLYYIERAKEGDPTKDAGAYLGDTMWCMKNDGLAPASDWEYNVKEFAVKPPQKAYTDAKGHEISSFKLIPRSKSAFLTALSNKQPFTVAFKVGKTFMNVTGKTGMLTVKDKKFTASHAVTCVGYCPQKKCFLIANSWGTNWGFKGYFLMSEALMLDPDVTYDNFFTVF